MRHNRLSIFPPLRWASALVLGLLATANAVAETTNIDVHVISKGAKFVGTSMGGVHITLTDVSTGRLLAEGKTAGTTGDTAKIMKDKHVHHAPVSTPDAAVFHAELDLDEPRRIEVAAEGPLGQPQAMNRVSATQWVVPGKHITGGDAFLLELPGFVVDILSPPAHQAIQGAHQTIELTANVTMMCGCPIEPDGLWDSKDFEMMVLVKHNGTMKHDPVPMEFAGETSQFKADVEIIATGVYEFTAYAYDPANGNTGLDKTTLIVRE